MASSSTYSTVIEDLYAIYLNRQGDSSCLQNFEAALAAVNAPTTLAGLEAAYGTNAAVTAVVNGFGTSTEFTSLYSADLSGTNSTVAMSASVAGNFVNAVFEAELGRAPLQAGLNFWTHAITSGELNVADATLAIVTAATANATDATAITNKIAVTEAFNAGLQVLSLGGNVVYGPDTSLNGVAYPPSAAIGGVAGVTVNAGSDNAHINVNLNGASAGNIDKITVGNSNDYITDGSTAGSVSVTVGSGSCYIDIHTGASAGVYSVTLGSHTATTGPDLIYTSAIGTFTGVAVANTTITGNVAGDILSFASATTTAANVTVP